MEPLPIDLLMLLFGFAGALVFAFVTPDRGSVWRAIANILAGTFASYALTPALCEWSEVESIAQKHAAAFLIGLVGQVLCKMIVASATSEAAKGAWDKIIAILKRTVGIKDEDTLPK